jgi:hypothetical protein
VTPGVILISPSCYPLLPWSGCGRCGSG